ncbi:MAG: iron-containing alcohol dehydrogenase [Trueperaceae bacterium]|nr:MAG: iron-containing alcohol dehydrogenase [Trueperaceae bacterium]
MPFEFSTANRIIFGNGVVAQLGQLASEIGARALLVGGRTPSRTQIVASRLEAHSVVHHTVTITQEPTVKEILSGLEEARQQRPDLVVAVGGGSVLDAGKAIAALLANPGEPLDYLEVVGRGKPLLQPAVPLIAIPTTSGTGAEVTRNAVIGVPEERVKVSMRSSYLLPRIALIDPELTHSLPPAATASTGLDALTQCLEPFVSRQANPLTDAIAREGLRRAARSLHRAYTDGSNATARYDMAIASLCGGLALANSKLGAVHGFAGVLGGMIGAAHGSICASLLPFVTEANITALQAHDPSSEVLERFDEVATLLTGNPSARAPDAVTWLAELCTTLDVSSLGALGLDSNQIPEVVEKAARASSMKGNPIDLSTEELEGILQRAL